MSKPEVKSWTISRIDDEHKNFIAEVVSCVMGDSTFLGNFISDMRVDGRLENWT